MVKPYVSATMAALRAVLVADPEVSALVGARVVDEPREGVAFPYVRFGILEPRADDTDGAQGAIVQVGLEVHSRPVAGRIEAVRICEAIAEAMHRKPEDLTYSDLTITEIEVQTWSVARGKDGAGYEGRLALEVHLDA